MGQTVFANRSVKVTAVHRRGGAAIGHFAVLLCEAETALYPTGFTTDKIGTFDCHCARKGSKKSQESENPMS